METWNDFIDAVEEGYDHLVDQAYLQLEGEGNSAMAKGFRSLLHNQRYAGAQAYAQNLEENYGIEFPISLD